MRNVIRKRNKSLITYILCFTLSLCIVTGCSSEKKSEFESSNGGEARGYSDFLDVDENDERFIHAKNEGTPYVIVAEGSKRPGDDVSVAVKIINNPGILGMSATISYDEKILKLKDIKNGEVFGDVMEMTSSKDLHSGCSVVWTGESLAENQIKDGVFLILDFQILDYAKNCKTPIVLVFDKEGTIGDDLTPVNLNIENGMLTITE